jgi:hypothetical protein
LIEEGATSFVPGIHVICDQIKSSTVPYLGKQIFPGIKFKSTEWARLRVQITLQRRRQIGVMPKRTDREADYMCFSPLRRKTSELEDEEEYTSRLVSGIT